MSEAEKLHRSEIVERLERIASQFVERDLATIELQKFTGADCDPASPKEKELQEAIERIHQAEDNCLSELVHLTDNCQKYFAAANLKQKDLSVVREFLPYKVAANYVNTTKHGSSSGQINAKRDYHSLFLSRQTETALPSDPVTGSQAFINFDGKLVGADVIMEALVRIWEMFIRFHTEIDTAFFTNRISEVFKRRNGWRVFTADMPDGVLKDAKQQSDARKSI